MFLDIFVEIILLGIIIGTSYYGYQKGLFGIATKPFKTVISFALAFVGYKLIRTEYIYGFLLLFLPPNLHHLFVNWLVLRSIINGVAFVLLFFAFRFIIGLVIKALNSILSIGIIGWINRSLGLLVASGFSLILANLFANTINWLFKLDWLKQSGVVSDFNGGLLYRLFDNFK